MHKEWKKLLDIKISKRDIKEWGKDPLFHKIKRSFDMSDVSPKNLRIVQRFIKDEIKKNIIENKHLKKWSPVVYHENTYKWHDFENKAYEKLLKKISRKLMSK